MDHPLQFGTDNGRTLYILPVTFPRVPEGGFPRTDQPDPGTYPVSEELTAVPKRH